MTTIVAFLTARLDEDEAAALATTPVPVAGQWKTSRDKSSLFPSLLVLVQGSQVPELDVLDEGDYVGTPVIAFSAEWQEEAEANLRHIARHDPARVLREVEAKRRILARHYADDDGSCVGCHFANDETRWAETIEECPELRDMASVYADHPDYEQSWSVE